MLNVLNTRISLRKDDLSNWISSNPILADGELAIIVDENGSESLKIGNGLSTFSQLCSLYSGEIKSKKLNAEQIEAKSISQGYNVKSTPTSLATGVFSEADGNFDVVHGIEAQALSTDDYAFVFNGTNLPGITDRYTSHGEGSFNINPKNGLLGFYIGQQNLSSLLSIYITEHQSLEDYAKRDQLMQVSSVVSNDVKNLADNYYKKSETSSASQLSSEFEKYQLSGEYALISQIPTKVSQLSNDSGYTTNTGTITGITMNGSSKGTSGVVNLGTVLTAIGISDLPSEVFVTKGSIATSTNLANLETGLWMINGISNPDFPIAEWLYGSLIQFPGTYKAQLICAGPAGEGGFYVRRYLTSSSSWTAWITIPTKTSQLTNDSNFLTAHQSLTAYATKSELTGYATKSDLNYDYVSTIANTISITLNNGKVHDFISFSLLNYNIYVPVPDSDKTADTIMIADYSDLTSVPEFTWYALDTSLSINWMNIEGDETEAGNKYMYTIQTMPNDNTSINGIMNIRKLNEGLSSN